MPVDPTLSFGARVLQAIKEWPLWMLVAIALSLTAFITVPDFRALLPDATGLLTFFCMAAWIFVAARAAKPISDVVIAYRRHREQSHHFFVTPIEHQNWWYIAKQADGSSLTQVAIRCMVKNRSSEPLYIMNARMVKPRIKGEILPGLVGTRAPDSNLYGTPFISGHNIAGGETLPVDCTLLIRGVPRQKKGPIRATVIMEDADGHQEWFKLLLADRNPKTT